MTIGTGWTVERTDTLKKLWADGLSASQIVAELGGTSRNGVLGKVHRMGLSGRYVKERKPKQPYMPKVVANALAAKKPVMRFKPTPEPVPEATDLPADESPFACTIDALTDETCRWPLGDPTYDMRYCGGARHSGAYCERHAAISYRPYPRRDRAA